jgi:hypothetical protein
LVRDDVTLVRDGATLVRGETTLMSNDATLVRGETTLMPDEATLVRNEATLVPFGRRGSRISTIVSHLGPTSLLPSIKF